MKNKAEVLAEARERLDSFDRIDGCRLRDAEPMRQLDVVGSAIMAGITAICNGDVEGGLKCISDAALMLNDAMDEFQKRKSPTA